MSKARFQVHTGTKHFYIYDYKTYDAVKVNGSTFLAEERDEADKLCYELNKQDQLNPEEVKPDVSACQLSLLPKKKMIRR